MEAYADEMTYHVGNEREMGLCHKEYKKKLGPGLYREAMFKVSGCFCKSHCPPLLLPRSLGGFLSSDDGWIELFSGSVVKTGEGHTYIGYMDRCHFRSFMIFFFPDKTWGFREGGPRGHLPTHPPTLQFDIEGDCRRAINNEVYYCCCCCLVYWGGSVSGVLQEVLLAIGQKRPSTLETVRAIKFVMKLFRANTAKVSILREYKQTHTHTHTKVSSRVVAGGTGQSGAVHPYVYNI